jgi:hypothetical protein
VRVEAGIEFFGEPEAADEKSRADEQQQRHGDLRDHEDAGKTRLASPSTRAAGFFLEHGGGRELGSTESR